MFPVLELREFGTKILTGGKKYKKNQMYCYKIRCLVGFIKISKVYGLVFFFLFLSLHTSIKHESHKALNTRIKAQTSQSSPAGDHIPPDLHCNYSLCFYSS